MTLVDTDSIVVYEIALVEFPLVVGEDDNRSDEELIEHVERRTTVEGMEWPEWTVFVDDPPDMETYRYVDTETRINVRVKVDEIHGQHQIERDVFDEVIDRVEIEGTGKLDMSHWGATHEDDFEGTIHLDLTDDSQ